MILSDRVSGKMSSCGILAAIGFALVALPSWSLGQQKAATEAAASQRAPAGFMGPDDVDGGEKRIDQDAEQKFAKHDFTNLQRLAAALENFNYPENAATTITVWCQGGGKGTSVQVTDANLDVAAACHLIVDGHYNKEGLDLERVAVQSADRTTIRFMNIKEKFFAGRPFGLNVKRGELVIILERTKDGKPELEVKDPEKLPEKEAFTAWGEAVGGLQAGLGFHPGEKRVYRHGETVTVVLRVRNVGKKAMKFSFLQPFIEHSPTVTDSDGKPVPQPNVVVFGIGDFQPGEVELPPGKEFELHQLKRQLRPASESGSTKFLRLSALYGTGKVSVQYEQVLGPPSFGVPGWKLAPALSNLSTGKLEFEIKSEQFPIESPTNEGEDFPIERTPKKVDEKTEKTKEALLPRGPYTTGPVGPDIAPQKGAFTARPVEPALADPSEEKLWTELGMKVERVPASAVRKAEQELGGGLKVLDVRPGSPASDAEISKDDIIVGLHIWETLSIDSCLFILDQCREDEMALWRSHCEWPEADGLQLKTLRRAYP